jgi:hypothetical protein
MKELLAILRDTEELFRVAEKCPSSELALILWRLDKAIVLEEYHIQAGNEFFRVAYEMEQEKQFNRLAQLGYVPLDDDLSWI